MADGGLRFMGGLFPVQALELSSLTKAKAIFRHLIDHGLKPVLHRSRDTRRPCITFIITAHHTRAEIDSAFEVIMSFRGHWFQMDDSSDAMSAETCAKSIPRSSRDVR